MAIFPPQFFPPRHGMHTNFQRLFFHLTFHSNLYFSFMLNRIIEFKCSNRKFKFINLSPTFSLFLFFFSIATCKTSFNNTIYRSIHYFPVVTSSSQDRVLVYLNRKIFTVTIGPLYTYIHIFFFSPPVTIPQLIFINGVYARCFRVLSKNTWKG